MMNNKIENEFKPRTWLLIVLIVIALGIVVVLANKIVLNRQERLKERENGHGIFNVFDGFFDEMEEAENKIEENNKKREVEDFNFHLESISGTTIRGNMAHSIDKVLDSNKKNPDHLITVCYKDTCTTDDSEIRSIKKTFTEKIPMSDPDWYNKSTKDYDVILDYDTDGYINKVTIEE